MNITGSALSFPFRFDPNTGSLATTATAVEEDLTGRVLSEEDLLIKEALFDLIETRLNELVMLPAYGLPDYLFSVMDAGFAARLAYQLETQIQNYIPMVEKVSIKNAVDEQGRAIVELSYSKRGSIESPKNLVFPVWQFAG